MKNLTEIVPEQSLQLTSEERKWALNNINYHTRILRSGACGISALRVALVCAVLALCSSTVTAGGDHISTSGFFTFEYETSNKDAAGKRGTFDLHHFNVLTNYRINENSRVFGEIEWEHGADITGSNIQGQIRLERAWYEYHFSDRFAVRVGKFLTPFGKYNLIHDATPTYTTTLLPSSVYGKHSHHSLAPHRMYAKFSGGVLIKGTFQISAWDLQYWGYVSNGRGSASFEKDNNNDKAFGGRFLFGDSHGRLRFGMSAYSERENKITDNALLNGVTGEATASVGKLLFEVEGIWFREETGDHTNIFHSYQGGYIQTEYSLTNRITPVARIDTHKPIDIIGTFQKYEYTVGFNIEVGERAFLKSETHFYSSDDPLHKSYRLFISSLAVAF